MWILEDAKHKCYKGRWMEEALSLAFSPFWELMGTYEIKIQAEYVALQQFVTGTYPRNMCSK